MATKEEIRARMAADGAGDVIPLEYKRWGTIHVRAILMDETERLRADYASDGEHMQLSALAAAAICTETGERVFDPHNKEDVHFLSKRRAADLMRVINAGSDSGN